MRSQRSAPNKQFNTSLSRVRQLRYATFVSLILVLCGAVFMSSTLFGQDSDSSRYVIFDGPDAISTIPTGINDQGEIVGDFQRPSTTYIYGEGFFRDKGGDIAVFNVPNAAWTLINGVNNRGDVIGQYWDGVNVWHAFVRNRDGSITTIDGPNASYTTLTAINNSGEMIGSYQSAMNPNGQSFIRDPEGNITLINVPNSTQTGIGGINDQGDIAGTFTDIYGPHGYIRDADGTYTTFNGPDNSQAFGAEGIDNEGEVFGIVQLANLAFRQFRGYVRGRDGTITVFNAPSAYESDPEGINNNGDIIGDSFDSHLGNISHGFIRDRRGSFTVFDVPGSRYTIVRGISDSGAVIGQFTDGTGTHGFVRLPHQ